MSELEKITLRPPTMEDGPAVSQLIENCPPLDTNSSYCNLLQCSHFAQTAVTAYRGDELLGFISGHVLPEQPDTLFIWQVAVSANARGLGLASKMLNHILARPHLAGIHYIDASITASNDASWALFKSLAKQLNTELNSSDWMDKVTHFAGKHDSEALVRLGPFTYAANKE